MVLLWLCDGSAKSVPSICGDYAMIPLGSFCKGSAETLIVLCEDDVGVCYECTRVLIGLG